MKTAIIAIALLFSSPVFAADECVQVGQMYYSAATQRDQAIPQDTVTKNIRKNFASLSNHYNFDLAVAAAFKHYDVSPEMLQGLASAKCEDDQAQSTNSPVTASPAIASGYGNTFDACVAQSNDVTADMLDCIGEETTRQDAQLNKNYAAAMMTRKPDQREELRADERAWIKERDSKCALDTSGGTAAQVNSASCMLDMTVQRAKELLATKP